MNLRSSSLRRSVMLAIFGIAFLGFGSVAANAQYGDGYNYGRQNVRQHRHHDRCGHDRRNQSPVYYGNGGYNNGGYYPPRRPVYRRSSSGLSTILRLVIGGGGRRHGRH